MFSHYMSVIATFEKRIYIIQETFRAWTCNKLNINFLSRFSHIKYVETQKIILILRMPTNFWQINLQTNGRKKFAERFEKVTKFFQRMFSLQIYEL